MIYNLTKENKKEIEKILKTETNVNVLYYMTFCGHCIDLKPKWNKIASKYENSKTVFIINVEADFLQYLDKKYLKNLVGYPTIIKYNKGKLTTEYEGERSFSKLEKFITNKSD
jgi:thiol-disulfide isomerase/thioredoxin